VVVVGVVRGVVVGVVVFVGGGCECCDVCWCGCGSCYLWWLLVWL